MTDKKQRLVPGGLAVLKVVRMHEMGAFLDAETGNTGDDILLHKEQQTQPVALGDAVQVYLYRDPKGRMTASMQVPRMKEGQVARVTVMNATKDGAFVEVGAERGVFLPFAEMRGNVRPGEKIWVKLYTDKSGRLAVTMDVDDELQRAAIPATSLKVGDTITGSVYNITEQGAFLFTRERYIAFLHHDEIMNRPKVGEEVEVRITFIRDDGRLNASMRPVKEMSMEIDAESILAFLKSRGGKMPYSDNTAPEIIRDKFNISKAAFKRAMGRLMKAGYIEQRQGWTYLRENKVDERVDG